MAIQIFISHSSDDLDITALVSQIENGNIFPYLAELQPAEPSPLHEKLIGAIYNSHSAFIFITKNVIENKNTRDMVMWELGVIHAFNRPAYVFTERGIDVPKPARFKSTSYEFNRTNIPELINVLTQLKSLSSEIANEVKQKETDDRNKKIAIGIAGILAIGLGAYLLTRRD